MVEADLQARRRVAREQREVRGVLDEGGEVRRRREGAVDLRLEARGAVVDPRERELEGVAAAAALQREVREVPGLPLLLPSPLPTIVPVIVRMEQIPRGQRVGAVEHGQVPRQQEGAGQGHVHHLVRVDGDAVGAVGAGEPVAVRGGEGDGPAPGRVDVQPEPELGAHVRERVEGVERAQHRRARRRVDVERRQARFLGGEDGGAERGGHHAARAVDGHGDDAPRPHARRRGGLLHAVVSVGAGEEREGEGGVAVGLGDWVEGVARDDE